MKQIRAKQTGLQKRSLYTITDLQTCPYYIIVWNRRQKESCSTDPVLRITPYLICHVLCLEQDGCSTSPLNIELMRFELKLQPHVVGSCTVCPVCTVATLLEGQPGYSPAAAPAFLTKNRPFRGQPVSLFHQPVEHVMLGVGELDLPSQYKTEAILLTGFLKAVVMII